MQDGVILYQRLEWLVIWNYGKDGDILADSRKRGLEGKQSVTRHDGRLNCKLYHLPVPRRS